MVNAFGVFQSFYENDFLGHMSPSAISWIGSVQAFFLLIVGVVGGPLYDAGHLKVLIWTGMFLVVVGMMMTSICTQYWQVMLAQAVCVGMGTGFLYIPSVTIVPQYFSTRKAIAVGIVTSGSSIGGVLYSLAFQRLQRTVGFGWACRVMGFIALATISVSASVLKRRTAGAGPARSLIDLSAFRERTYLLYCVSIWLSFLSFWIPVFYLQSYSLSHGTAGHPAAPYLITILNAASTVGRLIPSLIAARIGSVQTLLLSVVLTTIAVFAWIGADTAWRNIAFAVAFGFFSGGTVALPPVVLSSFTRDMNRLGTRMGMSSMLNAFGALIGAPAGGAILGQSSGNYLALQLFAGFMMVATAAFTVMLRFEITGKKAIVKV